jgi:hypothetical protein
VNPSNDDLRFVTDYVFSPKYTELSVQVLLVRVLLRLKQGAMLPEKFPFQQKVMNLCSMEEIQRLGLIQSDVMLETHTHQLEE